MDYSEKWGVDVEEAVKLALMDLKVSREEVEVTILEEPSKGFFGIGSKLALVRVEKKKKVEEPQPAAPVEEVPVLTEQNQKKLSDLEDKVEVPEVAADETARQQLDDANKKLSDLFSDGNEK